MQGFVQNDYSGLWDRQFCHIYEIEIMILVRGWFPSDGVDVQKRGGWMCEQCCRTIQNIDYCCRTTIGYEARHEKMTVAEVNLGVKVAETLEAIFGVEVILASWIFVGGDGLGKKRVKNVELNYTWSPLSYLIVINWSLKFFLYQFSPLILFFWFSSLVVGAHTIKYGEVGCRGFELRSLHKLCNVPTN